MNLQEEVLSSSSVFEGRLLKVRKEEVRMANGRMTSREIIEHPGAVTVIPIHDERVFLVRQFRSAVKRPLLEFPAGTLHAGEDPKECAMRELEEEIGYQAKNWKPLFQGYVAAGYSSELMHFFLAEELSRSKQNLDDDELIEVVDLPLTDLWKKVESGEIIDNKSILCALWVTHFIL